MASTGPPIRGKCTASERPQRSSNRLTSAAADIVRLQVEAGIDVVNDGEYGKPVMDEVDYRAWATYVHDRLNGFEMRDLPAGFEVLKSFTGENKDRRIWGSYSTPEAHVRLGEAGRLSRAPRRRASSCGGKSYFIVALPQRGIAEAISRAIFSAKWVLVEQARR